MNDREFLINKPYHSIMDIAVNPKKQNNFVKSVNLVHYKS